MPFLKITYSKDDGRDPLYVEVDTSPAAPFEPTDQFSTVSSSIAVMGPGRSPDGSRVADHPTDISLADVTKVELVDEQPAPKADVPADEKED